MFKIEEKDFSYIDFKKSLLIIKNSRKILVWGDEDADGITATIILARTLKSLGKSVEYFIPSRLKDGIGLVEKKVNYFLKKDFDTFITVDCGSVNYEIIKKIKLSGKNVIITDHHIPYKERIDKVPYINPYFMKSKKFKNLSGSGVSFIFSIYLLKKFKKVKTYYDAFLFDPLNISLAAVGTKCDKVKVDKTNEQILKYHDGIFYFIPLIKEFDFDETNICGIFANSKTIRLKNPMVEFFLNENTKQNFYIFLKNTKKRIENFKKKIEKYTQELDKKSYEDKKFIIIISDIDYKYVGVLSSILSKKYNRPVCVIGKKRKVYSAECRYDGENFNWLEILKLFEKFFEGYGGHKKAAGFEIKKEKIDEFVSEFNNRLNSLN
ncbi:MAG: DHH family phosphoesterase [candidate division WOR-3 bacterium]